MISRGANLALWAHSRLIAHLTAPSFFVLDQLVFSRRRCEWRNVNNVIGCPSSFNGLVGQVHKLERKPEVDPRETSRCDGDEGLGTIHSVRVSVASPAMCPHPPNHHD